MLYSLPLCARKTQTLAIGAVESSNEGIVAFVDASATLGAAPPLDSPHGERNEQLTFLVDTACSNQGERTVPFHEAETRNAPLARRFMNEEVSFQEASSGKAE